MRSRLSLVFLLSLCLAPVFAQAPPDAVPPPAKRRSATAPPIKKLKNTAAKSSNVREGRLAALTLSQEQVTLKESGTEKKYTLTEKTHFLKDHLEAQPEDFKPGMEVVLKLRKVRGKEEFTVSEFSDRETYQWLTALRKSPTTGRIKEIAEDMLTLSVAKDEVIYVLSEKTQWEKLGKPVGAGDFKAGETVTVAPRALPSGTIMAKIVADTLPPKEAKKSAGKGGRSLASTRRSSVLRGVLSNLDFALHHFTLTTDTETRQIAFGPGTEVKIRTKPASLSVLRNGQNVSVRLYDAVDEQNVARRITVEATFRRVKSSLPMRIQLHREEPALPQAKP